MQPASPARPPHPAATATATADAGLARLIAVNLTACLLLLAQYLLGMVTNLFVALPAHHPGAGAGNYFAGAAAGVSWLIAHGSGWAAAHAALGLALAVAALANIAVTWRRGGRLVTWTAVLGALLIVGAGFNGASFVDYGHDFSSMIMAGLWALALACYVTGLYLAARSLIRYRAPVAATGSPARAGAGPAEGAR